VEYSVLLSYPKFGARCSWDAEEYTLTGSIEWGEQFEDDLKKNALVCLNVNSATGESHLSSAWFPPSACRF
jgi:hypothetical protein